MIQNIVEYKVTKRSRGHCRRPLVDIVGSPDGDETVPLPINPANGGGNALQTNLFWYKWPAAATAAAVRSHSLGAKPQNAARSRESTRGCAVTRQWDV